MSKFAKVFRSCCFGIVIASVVAVGVYIINREILSLIFFVTIAGGSAVFEYVYIRDNSKRNQEPEIDANEEMTDTQTRTTNE